MAARHSGGGEVAKTGHNFNFDPALLSDPEAINRCAGCHEANNLTTLVAKRQANVSQKLKTLEQLKENAGSELEAVNGTEAYPEIKKDYDTAVFHISYVEKDGSLGVHNREQAFLHLETAEFLLKNVTEAAGAAGTGDVEEPGGTADEEGPGFGTEGAVAAVLGTLYLIKRKKRSGK